MDMKQYEKYLVYDEPILYKELKIYPIRMRDYLEFFGAVNCLTIEKNKIANPDIIRMSYLDFLFYLMNNDQNGQILSSMFLQLFKLCLKIDSENIRYKYDENGKIKIVVNIPYLCASEVNPENFLNDVFQDKNQLKKFYERCKNPIELIQTNQLELFSQLSEVNLESCQMIFDLYHKHSEIHEEYRTFEYDKNDFEEIKKIILYQNIPDYDDTYIDPKVEAVLKEAEDFMNKIKNKMASLEDQIICVLISTALNEEEIYDLTIRKFIKTLQRVDYKMHYEIYKQASMSGFVTFKEGIDHWMTEIKKNKYSDVIVNSDDYENLKNKIQNVN